MRYAIYHLPDAGLGNFGVSWLGWDVRRAETRPHPEVAGLLRPIDAVTEIPRRYGFHATMKAPMALAEGRSEAELRDELARIAARHQPFEMEMRLFTDWGFLCLRPLSPPPALSQLEADLVRELDPLRAPLTPEDRARRQPERLSEAARAHLDLWGYPHVLDLFRYHLTLSGPITPEEGATLSHALAAPLAPLLAKPMPVAALALVAEGPDKRFRLVEEIALGG